MNPLRKFRVTALMCSLAMPPRARSHWRHLAAPSPGTGQGNIPGALAAEGRASKTLMTYTDAVQ